MVGPDTYRCSRCKETKPKTTEFFYFRKNGYVNGYCKICMGVWFKAYWAQALPRQRERHRVASRNYHRRRLGITPDRYRVREETR
jgi:hypothetical protein